MTYNIEIIARELNFPEGPAFGPDGGLWAVELKGGYLVKYLDGELQRFAVGGKPNGIAIDEAGMIWFCDAGENSIRKFDPFTGECSTVATHVDAEVLAAPNDLAFDQLGNLVFTCPGDSRQNPTGYVCVWKPDGSVKKIITGKYFPNGLAFTADGKQLVIAETYKHQLWKGDWDALQATWLNGRIWCPVGGPAGPGGPDGMAFDRHGHLYTAVYGSGEVRITNPEGVLTAAISLPGLNPTNCAFDPMDDDHLVVTEAEQGVLLSIRLNN